MLDLPAETVEIIEKERIEIILKDLKEIGNGTLTGKGLKEKIAPILDLPAETLENILKDLNLKEIGNCTLACEELKQKIATVYKNKCEFYYRILIFYSTYSTLDCRNSENLTMFDTYLKWSLLLPFYSNSRY